MPLLLYERTVVPCRDRPLLTAVAGTGMKWWLRLGVYRAVQRLPVVNRLKLTLIRSLGFSEVLLESDTWPDFRAPKLTPSIKVSGGGNDKPTGNDAS